MNTYKEHALLFKAFCDENRLHIIDLLKSGEQCACTLQEALEIAQSTLSHHMKILTESGLVSYRKDGKWTYYSLNEEGAATIEQVYKNYLTLSETASTPCQCDDQRRAI